MNPAFPALRGDGRTMNLGRCPLHGIERMLRR
jgi:hypothetical protein